MNKRTIRIAAVAIGASCIGLAATLLTAEENKPATASSGQMPPSPPGGKLLLQGDMTDIPGWTMGMGTLEAKPGAASEWHYHNGYEFIYIEKGVVTYQIKGQEPVTVTAGQAYVMPPRVVHRAYNASPTESYKIVGIGLNEKGKPQRVDVKE